MSSPMIDPSLLSGSVSTYNGVVSFPVALGGIAAPGMEEALALTYSSDVQQDATTWNLDAPTGVAGLGWALGLSFIARLPSLSVAESRQQLMMFVRGQNSPLVRTGVAADGAILYAPTVFQPWTIRFYESDERWVIATEDGETLILGDRNSGQQTVGYRVVWANWFGASGKTAGQDQSAAIWLLSERKNQFGQGFEYRYTLTTTPVGDAQGATYMQAAYLSRITSTSGAYLQLGYAPKQAGEYVVPHTNPPPPNAYQSLYQTQYLQKVERYSRTGAKVSTVDLLYDDGAGGVAFLGSGAMAKRLLTGLRRSYASGAARPVTKFAYWGQDPNDGVTASAPYSAQTQGLYGAIKTVLLADGGQGEFAYAAVAPQYAACDAAVTPPAATAKAPRVAMQDDFSAVTWLAADGASFAVQACWWEGRWIAASLGNLPCANAAAYAAAPLSSSDTVLAAFGTPQLHLWRAAPGRPGAWIAPQVDNGGTIVDYYSPALDAGETAVLRAGRDFAGLLGQSSGKLFLYRFDGQAWTDQPAVSIGAAPQLLAVSAKQSALLVASLSTAAPNAPIVIDMFVNSDGAIARRTLQFANRQSRSDAISLVQGLGFAVVRVDSQVGGHVASDYAVIQWPANAGSLTVTWFEGLDASQTPVIAESTIAIGRTLITYDGRTWSAFNSDTVTYPNQISVEAFSPGAGVCVRKIKTSNAGADAYVYDLLAFDPNTGVWAVPAGMAIDSASGDGALAAARTYGSPSNYAVLNSSVYYRQPDASWTNAGALAVASAADAATLVLAGSRYAIYQTGSGGQSVATRVAPLLNGAAGSAGPLAGAKISVAGQPVDYLTGQNAFIAYEGDFAATPAAVSIHRLVRGQVEGAQTVYAAATVTLQSGYQTEILAQAYEPTYAVAQSGGWTGAYQKVTSLTGGATVADAEIGPAVELFFNGLTAGEAQGLDYPAGAGTNAAEYYGYVRGLSYRAVSYSKANPAANPVAEAKSWWKVSVARVGGAAQSAYSRQVQGTTTRDGVTRTTAYQYDANGFPSQIQTERYNSDNHRIVTTQTFTRWPEIYDSNGENPAPLTAPVVKTVSATQDATANGPMTAYDIQITTWSNQWTGSAGAWAPYKTFAALNASPGAFTHWNDTQPFVPDADGWRQTSVTISRAQTGLPVETADVLATRTSRIYDQAGQLITALGQNADVTAGEFSYLGFETYETLGSWRWAPSGPLSSHIISSDRNTGERCLAIPYSSDGATGPYAAFYPQQQSGAYVFGCWAKIANPGGQGAARWTIQAYKSADHSAVGAPLTLDLTVAGASWTLRQVCIDLAKIRQQAGIGDTVELYLGVSAGSSVQGATCLVDDVRFAPLNARFSASVYAPNTVLPNATLDDNGQVRRILYDAYDAPFAAIGAGGRVDQAQLTSFSRQLTAADVFLPEFGNTAAALSSLTSSYYDDFFSAQQGVWTFSPASAWAVSGGALNYSGGAETGLGGTATYAKQAHTNMGASVEIVSRDAAASVAIGNGDLFVRWNAGESRWELVRLSNGTVTVLAVNGAVALQRRMTITVVDGYAMAFAEGTQIFAYQYQYPDPVPENYGKFAIAATGPASFDNVVVFDDPSLAVSTSDGLGRQLQGLGLLGYQIEGPGAGDYPAQSAGVFLDAIGRPNVMRNVSQGPLEIAPAAGEGDQEGETQTSSLLVAAPADNLYARTGEQLSLAQYLDGYEGYYDYVGQGFEDSALSRPTALVLPRKSSAAAEDYTVSMTYGSSAALPDAPAADGDAHYFAASASRLFAITASGARITVTQSQYTDFDGRPLIQQTTLSDASVSQKQAFIYDDAGRLVTLKQPNAFDPPAGSTPETWQKSWQYTFEGWISQTTDPDSGVMQYLYDKAGRLRFQMMAAGAALNPQQIVYRKYDALSRVVETGTIQDANYDFAALAAKVDEEDFPQIVASNPGGPLQATGAWTYAYSYDRSASDDVANLIGRLYQVRINNGDAANPDSETFAYDIHGNTVQTSAAVTSYAAAETLTLAFSYNNGDLVSTITYPDKLTGEQNPFAVGYYYDRLGRLASVGLPVPAGGVIDPDNPPTPPERMFAMYNYDIAGRLVAVQLNNFPDPENPQPPVQRQFGYDDAGRLNLVADRYSSTRFDYDVTGGVGGVRYFTGLIASMTQENYPGALWPCVAYGSETVKFAYDGLGRLTASESDLGWQYRTTTGDAGAGGYDANGNMLTGTRGASKRTFAYKTTGGKRINNQVASVGAQADSAASIDFEGAAPDAASFGPWSWGANNGGPSGSHISTDHPHSGTKCLYLAGGGLTHSEQLALIAYLDPRGAYTLNGFIRTDSGFDQAEGQAYWRLSVRGPGQSLLDKQIAVVASSPDWTAFGPVTIDLSQAVSALGAKGDVVTVVLELVNAKRGANGATGPGLFIDDITVAGTVAGTEYVYDPSGRVSAAPPRDLYRLGYQPVIDRTNLIQLGDASGDKFVYGFDSGGERLVSRLTSADGSSTRSASVSLRGLGAEPLFIKTKAGGTETKRFRVPGLNGAVAYSDGGDWSYVLDDWLGSTELVFDARSAVSASAGYLPSGSLALSSGALDTDTLFAGQELNEQTGLYDFHARLYDPELGRFYATDPEDQYASPYLYAGNDPVNFVDPSGRFAILPILTTAIAGMGALGSLTYFLGLRRTAQLGLTAAKVGAVAGAVAGVLGALAGYLGAQFAASRYWADWGFHGVFTSVFDTKTVDYLQKGEFGFPLSLPGIKQAAISLGRVLFNFSRQEYLAISNVYPWTGPFMTPWVLVSVYRAVQEDIQRNWGADGWGNAARHFFWMGRAERFGGRALSDAIAEAHELGRPGTGELGFYDNVADKINNVLGQRYAAASSEDLQSIYDRLKAQGVLALSGEGSEAFRPDAPESKKAGIRQTVIHASFVRALAHVESTFGVTPHLEPDEREYLCKAIGWKCPQ